MRTDKSDKNSALKTALIQSIAQDAFVTHACKSAGVHPDTFYRWLKEDKDFSKAIENAKNSRIEIVEDALLKQCLQGNSTSTMFFLCNRAPERWRNIQRIEHAGYIERDAAEAEKKAQKERIGKYLDEIYAGITPGGIEPNR